MSRSKKFKLNVLYVACSCAIGSTVSFAQTNASDLPSPYKATDDKKTENLSASEAVQSQNAEQVDQIVVTAQKRLQRTSDVPMSINAFTGKQLQERGIETPADLVKIVPGFSFTQTQFDAPVYTLRGVGYYESSLAASPTVTVYVDQTPLPFPSMAKGAIFDLKRVEVLKGPQGTLFGQNSTGGAINYIANKPNFDFGAGVDGSVGSFGETIAAGYVTGPLSETARIRLATKTTQSNAWQESTTRTGDKLGKMDFTQARLTVDFDLTPEISLSFNVNGWKDKSDSQAAQLIGIAQAVPGPLAPLIQNAPLANSGAKQADWNPGLNFRRDNDFYQLALSAEWAASNTLTINSITAYNKLKRNGRQDADGTQLTNLHIGLGGDLSSFSQELRATSKGASRFNWIVGANYQNDRANDIQSVFLKDSPGSFVGPFQFTDFTNFSDQKIKSRAAFASGELSIVDNVSIESGVRFTKVDRTFAGCSQDSGRGDLASIFAFIQSLVGVPPSLAPKPGTCVTLQPNFTAGVTTGSLPESNTSWRTGINWKPAADQLLYANVSTGYKAGGFPTLSASSSAQFKPVVQEKVLAYETGFKVSLAEKTLQLNGALFYYDYSNKQLRGRIQDPVFGQLEALVNIPKSSAKGVEIQAFWVPIKGFTWNLAGTYVKTEIKKNGDGADFVNYTQFGQLQSFSGNAFPYSPKLQVTSDVEYKWGIGSQINAFLGVGAMHRSSTKGGLENDERLGIGSYSLFDFRLGIDGPGSAWRVALWGRNISNKYYWDNVLHVQDTIIRYAGKPAMYGVSAAYNF